MIISSCSPLYTAPAIAGSLGSNSRLIYTLPALSSVYSRPISGKQMDFFIERARSDDAATIRQNGEPLDAM